MLMDRQTALFWAPCATHYTDMMLEPLGKAYIVKCVIEEAKNITKFLYNHAPIL
jgi:hypothetical protein